MVTMTDVYISQVGDLKRKIWRQRDPQAEGYVVMDAGRDRQESGCCKPATPSMTTVTRAWKRVSPGHSLPQKPKRKTSTLRPSPQSLASASKGAQVSREAQLKLLQGATEHTHSPAWKLGRGETLHPKAPGATSCPTEH